MAVHMQAWVDILRFSVFRKNETFGNLAWVKATNKPTSSHYNYNGNNSKSTMVICHRHVGIISNTVVSDLIESHICESVCVHVYAAYRRITNTLLEDNIIKTWAFVGYAYVVDVHVTLDCGKFWIMSAEHFWVRVGNKCSKLRIRGTFLLV